jgi:2-polyprenyl-3-methyl-5-hydroxy-6-metoxy-1,4-benzoquinol methylase
MELFEKGIVRELMESGLLIRTERTDLSLPGYGLILKHRRLPWATKSFEWPWALVRDAGLVTLDLNLALLPHGLGTVDGHGSNLGQTDGCAPIWTDFGSIMPLSDLQTPLPEYRRFFVNPLRMLDRAPQTSSVVREVMRGGGLDDVALAALSYPRTNPLHWAPRVAQAMSHQFKRFRSQPQNSNEMAVSGSRRRLFQRARTQAEGWSPRLTRSNWTNYQHDASSLFPDSYEGSTEGPRRKAVFEIIRELRPKRLIDLAANAGFFSFFAAREGAEVLAMDYDEAAVEHCYRTARAKAANLPIACICADVMVQPVVERSADFVLALALTHHLLLGQNYALDAVASALSGPCTDTLLVEFMPNGLGGTRPVPDPLPEWYRLDVFLESLSARFRDVRVIDYPYNPNSNRRILILCRNPKSVR